VNRFSLAVNYITCYASDDADADTLLLHPYGVVETELEHSNMHIELIINFYYTHISHKITSSLLN